MDKKFRAAEAELQKNDPRRGDVIKLNGHIYHEPRTDYFFALCRNIVSQQISTAAASKIFDRLEKATSLQPKKVAAITDKQIKEIGLSGQKAGYIRDLAHHFINEPKVYNHLEKLSDDEVIAKLVAVKGIGAWTAQMFLMFTLIRLDVFAPDDIGIQRAMKQLYGWKSVSKEKMVKVAEKWRPYRTVACWHLWASLQNTPN